LQWGRFYVDNVSASQALEMRFEFFSPDTRTEEEMKTFSVNGTLLRWWILADLRAGLVFDTAGRVVGLREDFLKNLDEWLRLSRSSKTYLMPVLFDFLVAGTGQTVDGVQTFGRADLIMDAEKRASLLDKAIAPIFEKLSSSTEVAALDLFNEPEWALRELDIDIPTIKRPHEIPAGGVISLATMRTFFSELVELARQKGIKAPITVGSASPRWVTLWEGHVRWTPDRFDLSALYARGTISNLAGTNASNPGSPNPIPSSFYGYYVQGAYDVWQHGEYRVSPFARWEVYNMGASYEGTPGPVIPTGQIPLTGAPGDYGLWPRNQDRVWTIGANLYVTPHVVLKLDYQHFMINNGFTRFDLGLGLNF